jgi:hypothetical protein
MSGEPLVTFCVTVSRQRAAYLYESLKRKLCPDCSRELDACEADPCTLRRVHLGELDYCYQCGRTFDPAVVVEHICIDCRAILIDD